MASAGGKCGVSCGALQINCGESCAGGGGGGGGAGCGQSCGGGCDGFDETVVLSYVGTGKGEYLAETNYKYVGAGAGDIDMVVVPTGVTYGWCKWLLTIPMLLVVFWLWPQGETTTTTPFMPEGPKTCLVYGDPHIKTFDGVHQDYYSSGEYWIVKSATVWIQGHYAPTPVTNGLAVTKSIAISGPFLKGHTLIIDALTKSSWCTGKLCQPILAGFPSSFNNPDPLVGIQYNSIGDTMQKGREGKALHVLHITLPLGVSLQVNRWNEAGEGDYMNVKITMPPQPDQDGHCGTPNGNTADDDRMEVRKRLGTQGVAVADMLFAGPKTPIVTADRPDISNCPPAQLKIAEDSCKASEGKFIPSKQCLIDVCFGGKMFAQQDAV